MTNDELRIEAVKQHRAGNLDRAKDLYSLYLSAVPDDYKMWSNLGSLFRATKDFELAVAANRQALEGDEAVLTLNNASNAFFDAGLATEAVKLREQALDLEPDKASHHAMLAKFLRGAAEYQKAEQTCKSALKDFPDDVELNLQLALAQLSLGDYTNGFKNFEWRWQTDELTPPKFNSPQWRGENLLGKTILITPEQGFGDTILMARFLATLSKQGAEILLFSKPALLRLFEKLPGVTHLLNNRLGGHEPDYWAPIMDLPRYLGAKLETIEPPVLLTLPQAAITRAKRMVAPFKDKLKIGVLWTGSVTYRSNRKRSFDHRMFLKLADIQGLKMFSLYKGPLHGDFIKDGSHALIVDAAGTDKDFADSAALIRELDLVITIDSAIAHVAGSLGVEVWNLLHTEAYWLYEPHQHHTPWYPSMTLIRQEKPGDWDLVFERLHSQVSRLAARKLKDLSIKTIMTPIAPGELLDKLTILEIKSEHISDPEKLANVERERLGMEATVSQCIPNTDSITRLRADLLSVNKELWDIEDDIRNCEREENFDKEFIRLARAVYVTNDKRAALKKDINVELGSDLVEEKSYAKY